MPEVYRSPLHPWVARTCLQCGASFLATLHQIERQGGKYCSRACRDKGRQKGAWLTCHVCGVLFYRRAAVIAKGSVKYCSRRCKGLAIRTGEQRQCEVCGTPLYRSGSMLQRPGGTGRFCSKACAGRARPSRRGISNAKLVKPYPTFICKGCGEQMRRTKHRGKNQVPTFCTHACYLAYREKHREQYGYKGGRFPYGPNWPAQRHLARERDNHTCQDCGLHRTKPMLPVHHIISRRSFGDDYVAANDLVNLVTLCTGCHAHREMIARGMSAHRPHPLRRTNQTA